MKIKSLIAAVLLAASTAASAYTFVQNGIVYGTICRYGAVYTSYPVSMAQPVGTVCPLRDNYGNVIGQGVVVME